MNIELGKTFIWALPKRELVLTTSNRAATLDYESLSDENKRIVDESLARGEIVDQDAHKGPVYNISSLDSESLLALTVSDFRVQVIPQITTNHLQILNNLIKKAEELGKRAHYQLLCGKKRSLLISRKDDLIPEGTDSKLASYEFIQEEPGQTHNVTELIAGFEKWALESNLEKDNDSFKKYVEYLESNNGRS